MTARQFQNIIFPLLTERLFNCEVRNEWTAFNGFINHYSPRVDIAVGPFSVQPGLNQMQNYNNLVNDQNINSFLKQLYEYHIENIGGEIDNEITIPNFDDLINKNTDVISAYISKAPYTLQKKGVEYNIFDPKKYDEIL